MGEFIMAHKSMLMAKITHLQCHEQYEDARSLLLAAKLLTREANRLIRKKVQPTIDRLVKLGDEEAIKAIAYNIPSASLEQFYAFQANEAVAKKKMGNPQEAFKKVLKVSGRDINP
jgi:hypothetical protein